MQNLFANHSIFKRLHNAYLQGLAVMVPPGCISCDELFAFDQPPALCGTCWQQVIFRTLKSPQPPLGGYFENFYAPFEYEGKVVELISRFKFYNQTEMAAPLARYMARHMEEGGFDAGKSVIVPVPLHSRRLWRRKYNQAALLGKELAKCMGLACQPLAIKRVKNTPRQLGSSAAARRRQMAGAFQVSGDVTDKDILLVDDVWTTGSTAKACATALKKAGAKRVNIVTLAYVSPTVNF